MTRNSFTSFKSLSALKAVAETMARGLKILTGRVCNGRENFNLSKDKMKLQQDFTGFYLARNH